MEAVVVAGVVLLLVVSLVRELASPAGVLVGGLVLLVLLGVLPPERAFLGFASPATITVAGLFVVARSLRDHAGLDRLAGRLLGGASGQSSGRVLRRLLAPVAGLSGVMNNIPLVATTAPVVRDWAERRGVAASHLLMPLSFAAILGGTLTAIGTSTNLVVSGVLQASGREGFAFLDLTPVGLPLAVVGAVVLLLLAPRLLPDRRSPHERVAAAERDYTLRLRVVPGGRADHATVADAGLRELATTYLASIVRDGYDIAPVAPDTVLLGDDELVFVGRVDDVRDLLGHPGLVEAEDAQTHLLDGDGHQLVECVVGAGSVLAGTTLKATSFRGRFGGAVIAIHRAGERITGKLGEVRLRPGDALLVLADRAFPERWQGSPQFAVVVPLEDDTSERRDPYRWVTVGALVAMVGLAASGVLPIVTSVLLACSVLVLTRAISFRRAIDALDRDVLLIVGASIGIGGAIEVSGLAGLLADGIEGAAGATGPLLALALVVAGTVVMTELITNVAAAAMMAPVAIVAAERVDADPTGFAVAVAVAASASFLTPIGYQTNTIVYGLGGYRFTDYWRLGLPLVAAVMAVILVVVPRVWG